MLSTERLCMGCMNDNGGEKVCRICGYDSSSSNGDTCLPVKSWIKDRYLVGKAKDTCGESITYIGWDNAENTIVNIREYFPASVAQRQPDMTVSAAAGREYTYNAGITEFLELGKKLTALTSPAFLPVIDVVEENGTAYTVSKTVTGIPLREFLLRNGGTLKWEQARPLFMPLLNALKELNEKGIVHGGISPETVIVGRDGKLHISGICIPGFRLSKSDLSSQIFPGFAAIEQYEGEDTSALREYTDVYAFSATLFRTLLGITPPEATERVTDDHLSIPNKYAEELPESVLISLANGLQIRPENRTRTFADFKEDIASACEVTTSFKPVKAGASDKGEKAAAKQSKKTNGRYAAISAAITAGVFVVIIGILMLTVFRDSLFKSKEKQGDYDFTDPNAVTSEDIPSNTSPTEKLYSVPDFKGVSFAEIVKNDEYSVFEFEITGKKYMSGYSKGTVVEQSVDPGTTVKKETKIQIVLSLGPANAKIANVHGMTKEEAAFQLMRQGFDYDNITFVDKYDEAEKPLCVIETDPAIGEIVVPDVPITVFVNSYEGENGEEDHNQTQY